MGDVFEAYKQLSKTFGIANVGHQNLFLAEASMKLDFGDRMGYKVDKNFLEDWEFVVQLVPRRKALTKTQQKVLNEVNRELTSKKRTSKSRKTKK